MSLKGIAGLTIAYLTPCQHQFGFQQKIPSLSLKRSLMQDSRNLRMLIDSHHLKRSKRGDENPIKVTRNNQLFDHLAYILHFELLQSNFFLQALQQFYDCLHGAMRRSEQSKRSGRLHGFSNPFPP